MLDFRTRREEDDEEKRKSHYDFALEMGLDTTGLTPPEPSPAPQEFTPTAPPLRPVAPQEAPPPAPAVPERKSHYDFALEMGLDTDGLEPPKPPPQNLPTATPAAWEESAPDFIRNWMDKNAVRPKEGMVGVRSSDVWDKYEPLEIMDPPKAEPGIPWTDVMRQGVKDTGIPFTPAGVATTVLRGLENPPETEPRPQYDFRDAAAKFVNEPGRLIPFANQMFELSEIADLSVRAARFEQGEATKEDYDKLYEWAEANGADAPNRTIANQVLETVAQMPAFMYEMGTTGGLFTSAKKGAEKAAIGGLKRVLNKSTRDILRRRAGKASRTWLATKGAAGIVGATAQFPLARMIAGPAAVMKEMMPQIELSGPEKKLISKEGEDLGPALYKGLGKEWVEVLSEQSGGAIQTVLTKPVRTALARTALFKSFKAANPTGTLPKFNKLVKRLGYHGIIEEMGEERFGEIVRYAMGIDDEYQLPTGEQILVEGLAFWVPGMGRFAGQKVVQAHDRREAQKRAEARADRRLEPRIDAINTTEPQTDEEIRASIDATTQANLGNVGYEGPIRQNDGTGGDLGTAPDNLSPEESADPVTAAEMEQLRGEMKRRGYTEAEEDVIAKKAATSRQSFDQMSQRIQKREVKNDLGTAPDVLPEEERPVVSPEKMKDLLGDARVQEVTKRQEEKRQKAKEKAAAKQQVTLLNVISGLGGIKWTEQYLPEYMELAGNERGRRTRAGLVRKDGGEPSDVMAEILAVDYPGLGIETQDDLIAAMKDWDRLITPVSFSPEAEEAKIRQEEEDYRNSKEGPLEEDEEAPVEEVEAVSQPEEGEKGKVDPVLYPELSDFGAEAELTEYVKGILEADDEEEAGQIEGYWEEAFGNDLEEEDRNRATAALAKARAQRFGEEKPKSEIEEIADFLSESEKEEEEPGETVAGEREDEAEGEKSTTFSEDTIEMPGLGPRTVPNKPISSAGAGLEGTPLSDGPEAQKQEEADKQQTDLLETVAGEREEESKDEKRKRKLAFLEGDYEGAGFKKVGETQYEAGFSDEQAQVLNERFGGLFGDFGIEFVEVLDVDAGDERIGAYRDVQREDGSARGMALAASALESDSPNQLQRIVTHEVGHGLWERLTPEQRAIVEQQEGTSRGERQRDDKVGAAEAAEENFGEYASFYLSSRYFGEDVEGFIPAPILEILEEVAGKKEASEPSTPTETIRAFVKRIDVADADGLVDIQDEIAAGPEELGISEAQWNALVTRAENREKKVGVPEEVAEVRGEEEDWQSTDVGRDFHKASYDAVHSDEFDREQMELELDHMQNLVDRGRPISEDYLGSTQFWNTTTTPGYAIVKKAFSENPQAAIDMMRSRLQEGAQNEQQNIPENIPAEEEAQPEGGTQIYRIKNRKTGEVLKWGASRFGNREDEEVKKAVEAHFTPGADPDLQFELSWIPKAINLASPQTMQNQRVRNAKKKAEKFPLFTDQFTEEELKKDKYSIEAAEKDRAEKEQFDREFIGSFWQQHSEDSRVTAPGEEATTEPAEETTPYDFSNLRTLPEPVEGGPREQFYQGLEEGTDEERLEANKAFHRETIGELSQTANLLQRVRRRRIEDKNLTDKARKRLDDEVDHLLQRYEDMLGEYRNAFGDDAADQLSGHIGDILGSTNAQPEEEAAQMLPFDAGDLVRRRSKPGQWKEMKGEVVAVDGDQVEVQWEDGRTFKIPAEQIEKQVVAESFDDSPPAPRTTLLLAHSSDETINQAIADEGWGRLWVPGAGIPKPKGGEPWGFDNGAWSHYVEQAKKAEEILGRPPVMGQDDVYEITGSDGLDVDKWVTHVRRVAAIQRGQKGGKLGAEGQGDLLGGEEGEQGNLLFVVLPDLVGGGDKSLGFSMKAFDRVKQLDLPFFLAVQPGMDTGKVKTILEENDQIAGIFIGGSDEWKIETGKSWVDLAHGMDKKVHIGRTSTVRKLKHAMQIGADSGDTAQALRNRKELQRIKNVHPSEVGALLKDLNERQFARLQEIDLANAEGLDPQPYGYDWLTEEVSDADAKIDFELEDAGLLEPGEELGIVQLNETLRTTNYDDSPIFKEEERREEKKKPVEKPPVSPEEESDTQKTYAIYTETGKSEIYANLKFPGEVPEGMAEKLRKAGYIWNNATQSFRTKLRPDEEQANERTRAAGQALAAGEPIDPLLEQWEAEDREKMGGPEKQPEKAPDLFAAPQQAEKKQPWQMTQEEYIPHYLREYAQVIREAAENPASVASEKMAERIERAAAAWEDPQKRPDVRKGMQTQIWQSHAEHKRAVQAAIGRGDTVPAEVLAEYPDLRSPEGMPNLIQGDNGRWHFVGRADFRLMYGNEDGGDATPEQIDAAKHAGPGFAKGLVARSWDTREEAIAAWEGLQETVAAPQQNEPITADNFRDRFQAAMNLSDKEADAAATIVDARASVWAKKNDKDKEEYYRTRFADFVRGEPGDAEMLQQIDAWHGGRELKGGKFSTQYTGTGEGSMARGWGLYFTDTDDIGKFYADLVSRKSEEDRPLLIGGVDVTDKPGESNDRSITTRIASPNSFAGRVNHIYWEAQTVADLKEELKDLGPARKRHEQIKAEARGILKRHGPTGGPKRDFLQKIASSSFEDIHRGKDRNLYKVALHKDKDPSEYTYLNWDDVYEDEVEKQIEAQFLKEVGTDDLWWIVEESAGWNNPTGGNIYHGLMENAEDLHEARTGEKASVDYLNTLTDKEERNWRKKEASLFLLRAGFDGIKFQAGTMSGVQDSDATNYVVFDENAVSVEEHILYQRDQAPTFYSQVRRVIEEKMGGKAQPNQIMAMLKKAPGVKQEELDWLGVLEFLRGKKSVTKDELLAFIDANEVTVEEVEKGEGAMPDLEFFEDSPGLWGAQYRDGTGTDWAIEEEGGEYSVFYAPDDAPQGSFDSLGEAQEDVRRREGNEDRSSTSYGPNSEWNVNLPGGENYRELLLTVKHPQVEPAYDTHWGDEPVDMWVRFDDRTDAEGKKTLFIQEIQAGRYQQGRKRGYKKVDAPPQLNFHDWLVANGKFTTREEMEREFNDYHRRQIESENIAAWHRDQDVANENAQGVPDAPFKTSWQDIAMKRMLRYAAENGYDRVAWTTGAQQTARYEDSTRQQVDTIEVIEFEENGYQIKGEKGGRSVFSDVTGSWDRVEKLIGKEMASRALEQIEQQRQEGSSRPGATLKGEDLTIGGEGMKGFYSKMLPAFLKKYTKKWGAKVGETVIGTNPLYSADEMRETPTDLLVEKGEGLPVHAIDITPKMRESVMQGQPLFQRESSVEKVLDRFRKTALITNKDAAALLGEYPAYLDGVVQFMMEQRQKVVAGEMTGRDIAKAYLLTVGSQGSDAVSADRVEKAGNFTIPEQFTSTGKQGQRTVRPEEALAAWMFTEQGQKALDSIDQGEVDREAWQGAIDIRKAFGDNRVENVGMLREPRRGKFNLTNLGAFVEELNAAKGDSKKIGTLARRLNGVGNGKEGFIKHLLGMGDMPTIDAVEINWWLTGRADTRRLQNAAARLTRDIKEKSTGNPRVISKVRDRILQRFQDLRREGVGRDQIPEEIYNHVLHHWIWDRAKGIETTHEGMYEAMRLAQGEGDPKGGTQFLEDGRALIHAFEQSDISTGMHELGHVFRRDLEGKDKIAAERWAGAKDGKWDVKAEEKFARGFERYLAEGKAPNARLERVFSQFKDWLLNIYKKITGSAIDINISAEMRGVFGRLLDADATGGSQKDVLLVGDSVGFLNKGSGGPKIGVIEKINDDGTYLIRHNDEVVTIEPGFVIKSETPFRDEKQPHQQTQRDYLERKMLVGKTVAEQIGVGKPGYAGEQMITRALAEEPSQDAWADQLRRAMDQVIETGEGGWPGVDVAEEQRRHERQVKIALRRGKAVPAEVLADYNLGEADQAAQAGLDEQLKEPTLKLPLGLTDETHGDAFWEIISTLKDDQQIAEMISQPNNTPNAVQQVLKRRILDEINDQDQDDSVIRDLYNALSWQGGGQLERLAKDVYEFLRAGGRIGTTATEEGNIPSDRESFPANIGITTGGQRGLVMDITRQVYQNEDVRAAVDNNPSSSADLVKARIESEVIELVAGGDLSTQTAQDVYNATTAEGNLRRWADYIYEKMRGPETPLDVSSTDIGTPSELNVPALGRALEEKVRNREPLDVRKLKNTVMELAGITDKAQQRATKYDKKGAEEALEYAIAREARDIITMADSEREAFDGLMKLYEWQPNLSTRTSTSIANQAYSTPAPLAFLAQRLAGITGYTGTTVYEPTAGTGMLVTHADPAKVIANELGEVRAQILGDAGFQTVSNDATQFVPDQKVDVVIANPPFGALDSSVRYEGKKITKLDHLISLKALEAMEDEGRAVLILGASKKAGEIPAPTRTFLNYIYGNFNVADHFEVDGKLYGRQGASWPVQMIVLDGRQVSDIRSPQSGTLTRLHSWEDIYERAESNWSQRSDWPRSVVKRSLTESAAMGAGGDRAGGMGDMDTEAPGGRGDLQGVPGGSGAVDGGGAGTRGGQEVGESEGSLPERQPEDVGAGDRPGDVPTDVPGGRSGASGGVRGGRGGVSGERSPVEPGGLADKRDRPITRRPVTERKAAGGQTEYESASELKSGRFLTPTNAVTYVERSLDELRDRVGDLDSYVKSELGYEDDSAFAESFMGVQVDALALSLNAMGKGKGMIIGDQTGVGKGRVAAGIIKWAKRQGKTPVFFTARDDLFNDMVRDLEDIGVHNPRIFVVNNGIGKTKESIRTPDGRIIWKKLPDKRFKEAIQRLPDQAEAYDAIFVTYSQVQNSNFPLKRNILEQLAENNVLVLDEAHKSAGASNTGEYLQKLLTKVQSVLYLSATYAKRADNMPIYFRTDLAKATVEDVQALASAIQSGGVPLQEIVAAQLSEAGQYIRREKDLSEIELKPRILFKEGTENEPRERDVRLGNQATSIIRRVMDFSDAFNGVIINTVDVSGGEVSEFEHTNQSLTTYNFVSTIHNNISQLLFSLKADDALNEAIAASKRGEKPVITLQHTLGSFLDHYADIMKVSVGDEVRDFDFRSAMERMLRGTMRYTIVDENGDKTVHFVTPEELQNSSPEVFEMYEGIIAEIDQSDLSELPGSPIDYIRQGLEDAGVTTGEITGRGLRVDYADRVPRLVSREDPSKPDTIIGFNEGSIGALILNSAGAEGLSIHSSEKFADQQRRHMIVLEANPDVNVFMQILGRVDRTGQVNTPLYTLLQTGLPGEMRPAGALLRKLASLHANISADAESKFAVRSMPDMFNRYGDDVVWEYMRDNEDLAITLGVDVPTERPDAGYALQTTGRVAILPVDQQQEFWDTVTPAYEERIDYLTKTGQNDLVSQDKDLQAEVIHSEVVFEGEEGEEAGPFDRPANLEFVKTKRQGKPPTVKEIQERIEKTLGEQDVELVGDTNDDFREASRTWRERFVADLEKQADEYIRRRVRESIEFDAGAAEANVRGTIYAIPELGDVIRLKDDNDHIGTVVEIRHRPGKGGNPVAASKVQVVLALNSPQGHITVPVSQLRNVQPMYVGSPFGDDVRFVDIYEGEEALSQTEERHIVTGNLLSGYDAVGLRGEFVNFTRADGGREMGILLPKNWKPSDATKGKRSQGGRRLRTVEDVLAELSMTSSLQSQSGRIDIRDRGDRYELRVPKAKRSGGKFFGDESLVGWLGDFVSSGNQMVVDIPQENDQVVRSVLQRLMDLGERFKGDIRMEVPETEQPQRPTIRRPERPPAPPKPKLQTEPQTVFHTKKKKDVYIVGTGRRLEDEEYQALKTAATELGGYYARRWGSSPAGFTFEDEAKARQFIQENNAEEMLYQRAEPSQEGGYLDELTNGKTSPHAFDDEEMEGAFQGAYGVGRVSLGQKIQEGADKFWRRLTREWEHLPHTGEFAPLRFDLNKMQKQAKVAQYKAVQDLDTITDQLTADQLDLVRRKAILDDLVEDRALFLKDREEGDEEEYNYPFQATDESFGRAVEKIDAHIAEDEQVQEALKIRRKAWGDIKGAYVREMNRAGFKADKRLARENYFRHQVLEYARVATQQQKRQPGGGNIKTPTGRSFLQQRGNSGMDFNTNYIEAEYEVMAQMLFDVELARTIGNVKDNYDQLPSLKAEAKAHNDRVMVRVFDEMAQAINQGAAPGSEPLTGEDLYRSILNTKTAMGFAKLTKLALDDNLPDDNGQWDDVIDDLIEQAERERDSLADEERPAILAGSGRVLAYANWLLENHGGSPASSAAAIIFKGIGEKKKYIEETLTKIGQFKTWKDYIPEGYAEWYPREKTMFYMAQTIPERAVEEALEQGLKEIDGIPMEKIQKVLALAVREPLIVKQEVVDTLDDYARVREERMMSEFMTRIQTGWKLSVLLGPFRAFKYNFRNVTGDLDAVISGNPRLLTKNNKHVRRAARELGAVMFRGRKMQGDMMDWFERGGMGSTLQIQELGEVGQHWGLKPDPHDPMKSNWEKWSEQILKHPLKTWIKAASIPTEWREGILRYAAYLDYKEQFDTRGRPDGFAASIPEEVMALEDNKDRAFKMSNDLLGAYDEVGQVGQELRRRFMAFWSWHEVNFRRYKRIMQNALNDGQIVGAVGRKLAGATTMAPYRLYQIGRLGVRLMFLQGMFALWNAAFPDDDEEAVPKEVRERPYLLIPSLDALARGEWSATNDDSKTNYFSRLGAFPDLLEWVGADALYGEAVALLDGTVSLQELAQGEQWVHPDKLAANARKIAGKIDSPEELAGKGKDIGKGFVNKLATSISPLPYKFAFEIATQKQLFPDVFQPRFIRDRKQYAAQLVGLDPLYKATMTITPKDWKDLLLTESLIYRADAMQTAYGTFMSRKRKFMDKIGKGGGGFGITPRSNALYHTRLAVRAGDEEAAKTYLKSYFEQGGKVRDIRRSFEMMHPLAGGLNEEERNAFVETLDDEGKLDLEQAVRFYEEVLIGPGPEKVVFGNIEEIYPSMDKDDVRLEILRHEGKARALRKVGKRQEAKEAQAIARDLMERAGGRTAWLRSLSRKERANRERTIATYDSNYRKEWREERKKSGTGR